MIAEALSSLFPARRSYSNASLENPTFSLNDPAAYDALTSGQRASSGVVVTHENSLSLPGVWQAVSLISGDGAKLPLYSYKRMPEDDREIDDKHQWYFPVAIRANPVTSAFQFWRTYYVHGLIWNNAYAYIARSGGKNEFYHLLPDRTSAEWVKVESGGQIRAELVYVTEVAGHLKTLLPSQVLHLRGISLDGKMGYDLTKAARDAWGLAMAAQNFESKFFKNGARIGGILEIPGGTSKSARDTIEEGFRRTYEEGDNPFKTVILREGAKFHAGQVTPEQGQVVEMDEKGKRDVASYFNIPPSKLGIRDSVSYNSFEQDNLSYLHGCLHHWTCAVSDECDMKLLSEKELRDDTHYFEHNYSQFVQADWKTLNEGLEIMRRNEVINADEWRRKLNLNKRPDGGGGEYINPNTRSPDGEEKSPAPPKKPPAKTPDTKAHRELFFDTLARMVRRVAFDARKAATEPKKFVAWLDGKAEQHQQQFTLCLAPVCNAYSESFGGSGPQLAAAMREEFFSALLADLSAFTEPPHAAADLERNVDTYLKTFERTAPERVAATILEESCPSTV